MSQSDPPIPWPQVTKFIGQLNHDLRNHLNAIELQSAFLGEIVAEDEAKEEVKRLRAMTAEMGAQLHRLSSLIGPINLNLLSYRASELLEDLRARVATNHPEEAAAIEWETSLGEESIEIDPQYLLEAFAELFANALRHGRGAGPLHFCARAEEAALVFALREPKAEAPAGTENWGKSPLGQMRHGHYGLGLFRARSIFEAHHGSLRAEFDPAAAVFTTEVVLPRADA